MAQQKQKSTAESKAKAAATRAQNKRRAEFHRQLRAVTQLLFGVFLLCCMIAGLIAPETVSYTHLLKRVDCASDIAKKAVVCHNQYEAARGLSS